MKKFARLIKSGLGRVLLGIVALTGLWLAALHTSDAVLASQLTITNKVGAKLQALGVDWTIVGIGCPYSQQKVSSSNLLGLPISDTIQVNEFSTAYLLKNPLGAVRAITLHPHGGIAQGGCTYSQNQ
jgi:hypothetical protein